MAYEDNDHDEYYNNDSGLLEEQDDYENTENAERLR